MGPITAGNWNVAATGALQGDVVFGSDLNPLVTASLDIDQMATTAAGFPPLGAGVAHDYGPIAFDVGYEVVDVRAELELGFKQSFTISSDVIAQLQFSENVMIGGVETDSYLGPLDAIPDVTLLSDSVTVDPVFMVDAELNNDTDLTVTERLPITLFEGHANVSWDVAGVTGSENNGFGPVYQDAPLSNTNAINVYSNQFDLGGFDLIQGESFVLATGFAGDLEWIDTTPAGSDFNTSTNWTESQAPTAQTDAIINNGGTAIVSSIAAANDLSVGGSPEGGTLKLEPGGDLTAQELAVRANGTVEFHGGAVTATSYALEDAVLYVAQDVTQASGTPVSLTGSNTIDVDSGGSYEKTGVISGTGSFTKQGVGTLILSAANTYSGGTTIEEGTLKTGANDAIPPGQVTIHGGGMLDFTGFEEAIGPGGLALTGLELQGDAQVLAGERLQISTLGTFVDYSAGTTPTGASIHSGQLSLGTSSSTRTFHVADNPSAVDDLHISATVSNAADNPNRATPVMNKTGAGRMTLSGTNTFWRGVRISEGVLRVESDGGLGNTDGTANTGTEVMEGATLELSGGVNIAGEHLTLDGTLHSTSGTNTWTGDVALSADSTIGVDSESLTIGGGVSGDFNLTKLGPGDLSFDTANTYTGDTIIEEGTLSLAQAYLFDTADVILDLGATLDLTHGATDTIDEFLLGGFSRAVGTHGAIGSDADFESAQITGNGLLSVTSFTGLAGDFNGDGTVDTADYSLWLVNIGAAAGTFVNDPNAGTIGQAQYNTWKTNLGNTAPGDSVGNVPVPEPAVILLGWLAIGCAVLAYRPTTKS